MTIVLPSPNPAASPPFSTTLSPPPLPVSSPPTFQPNADPPELLPTPTPQSHPIGNTSSPPPPPLPPDSNSPPPPLPPDSNSPPPPFDPSTSSPPPVTSPHPPSFPPVISPPLPSPPPPPPPPSSDSLPPTSSNPSLPAQPPRSSPPPPLKSETPLSSPPPPKSETPSNSPPPPKSETPSSSPPPPKPETPSNSPPPPKSEIPLSSPPPPTSKPPLNSLPPPSEPPKRVPPPPAIKSSTPPSPLVGFSPPLLPFPPTPTPPSHVPVPPSGNILANNTGNSSSPNNGDLDTGGIAIVSLVLGFLLLSLIGIAAWCISKRRKNVSRFNGYVTPLGSSRRSDSALINIEMVSPKIGSGSGGNFAHSPVRLGRLGNLRPWFTYEEMIRATNGFSEENILGKGGFGSVYKGYLPDGREIAVKQLKIGGGQGEREFKAEVEIISRIHHRHLVSLVGYCISEERRLLVYEYVPNDTLYYHLHGAGRPVLNWETRMKIAAGAARGIAYLHEDCHPRVIHRDIKSSNILLDLNFEARVSDFGLAKLYLDVNSHVTTRVMGTFGYMAPEYASSGRLTEKSDIFSFGVVLLELITGRKPVDPSQPLTDEGLVEWARPLLGRAMDCRELDELVDPRLENNYASEEMFHMIEAAASCIRHSATKRPLMGQIVRVLESMSCSWDLSNGMRVGESQIINSGEQWAEIRLFRKMAFGMHKSTTDILSSSNYDCSNEVTRLPSERG